MSSTKIVPREEIKALVEKLRAENPSIKIVTSNGCFDLIHHGHVHSFTKAKEQGDILIVGLNSDASVRRLKGETRPLVTQEHRAGMIAGLEAVDYVTFFEEDDPRNLLDDIKPNVHAKSNSGFKGIETEVVEKNGGEIKLIDDLPGLSTTSIVEKMVKSHGEN